MESSLEALLKVEHGFKPFEEEAKKIVTTQSRAESKEIALDLLKSKFYQLRCCAIFILGFIAAQDPSVLVVLKERAHVDDSWQVQEIIAKAFDQYCADHGYENSLPEIKEWLSDQNPNVCRAVTEGLRIWTSRAYFKEHPQVAIELIAQHKSSDSEYLRKSVGNALRDISKKHPELIEKEISSWNLNTTTIAYTYAYVKKRH